MIELDIVTPVKKLLEGAKVGEVRLPAIKGEVQILPGHTELLTLLDTGILSFSLDGRERKFAISWGFAEIRMDRVIVLAETAEDSSGIDLGRAKAAQKKAEETLTEVLPEGNFKKYQLKLQRAIIRQKVVG